MAQGPAIEGYTPQVPETEAIPRRITPSLQGISIGPSISNIGNILQAQQQHSAEQDAAAQASSTMADARLNWTQQLIERQQNWKPGDPDMVSSFLEDFSKYRDKAMQGMPTPMSAQFLGRQLDQLQAEIGERAMHFQAQTTVQGRVQSFSDATTKAAAALQIDPSQYDSVRSEQLQALSQLQLDPGPRAELATHMDQEFASAAALGISKLDPHGAYMRLNDPNDSVFTRLSPEARATVYRASEANLVDQKSSGILSAYQQGGTSAGTAALAAIDHDSGIPDDLKDEVRQKANGAVEQWRVQRRQQFSDSLSKLETDIASGQPGSDDIALAHQLYQKGVFSPEQLAGSLASITRTQLKNTQGGMSAAEVQNAYNSRIPLDPKDKDVRDAVGDFFTNLTKGVNPGSPEYSTSAAEFAVRTGVVPQPAVTWARANLISGNAQQAAQAADLLARVEEASPRAVGYAFEDREKAMADSIAQSVKAGTPPQIAVDQARRQASLPHDQLELIEKQWKQSQNDTKLAGDLTGILRSDPNFKPGFFSSVPTVPVAMQADFDAATRRYYDLTNGNYEQSKNLAARDLVRVWGVSEVNGKRELMPYAPERMYPGLTVADVRSDVEKTVADNAQAFQRLDPASGQLKTVTPNAADLRLIPTDRTARTNGRDWALGAPDEIGAQEILRGKDGLPLVYKLPVASADFEGVRQRQAQAEIASARALSAKEQTIRAMQANRTPGRLPQASVTEMMN